MALISSLSLHRTVGSIVILPMKHPKHGLLPQISDSVFLREGPVNSEELFACEIPLGKGEVTPAQTIDWLKPKAQELLGSEVEVSLTLMPGLGKGGKKVLFISFSSPPKKAS